MITRLVIFFACLITVLNCFAQVSPPPGAKLNYTQVMFDYKKVWGASLYLVKVEAVDDSVDLTEENCSFEQTDSATATLITGLEFGRKYQWQYAGIKPGEEPVWNGPYSFEITQDTLIDKNIMSLDVSVNDSAANAGGLIVNDCTHTIVDRTGKMVWYLANVKWKFSLPKAAMEDNVLPKVKVRVNQANQTGAQFEVKPAIYDLRVSPFGTITCLEETNADPMDSMGNIKPVERNLDCHALWLPPKGGKVSGNTSEYYNHDFKHLPNGHYMVLGNENWRKIPAYHDTTAFNRKYQTTKMINGRLYARVEFGTVIEYDKRGKVVWSWNSEHYFDSDALSPVSINHRVDVRLMPHINAFSADLKNEFIYVGFRDISRIIKIEKATGQVVDSWGGKTAAAGFAKHLVALHQQHDANILDNGNIAVFNNNDYPGRDSLPSAVVFSQQPGDSGYIVWKYEFDLDKRTSRLSRTGGNVDLLKNGNYLVCLGNLDKMVEITPDKKIVWQAEIKPNLKRTFSYFHRLYRAHYISSLYPCYFSFQTDKDTVSKKAPQFSIRLFNKGSEPDAYNITVTTQTGAPLVQFAIDTVQAYQSATIPVALPNNIHRHQKIIVIVTSKTNPDFERRNAVLIRN